MRPICRLLPVTVLVALAAAPLPQQTASASCAAPYLKNVGEVVLERGERHVVEGRAFVHGCQDAMGCTGTLGCQSCSYDEPPEAPMTDVRLRLVQDGRAWLLDEADAGQAADNQSGWVTWEFELPPGVEPGPARFQADGALAERITIG